MRRQRDLMLYALSLSKCWADMRKTIPCKMLAKSYSILSELSSRNARCGLVTHKKSKLTTGLSGPFIIYKKFENKNQLLN